MLHFPDEPLRFRALRLEAHERFCLRYRRPVLRRFGLESEDLGVFVVWCDDCQRTAARLIGFPELDFDLTLDALEEEVRTRADASQNGWRPEACPHCAAPAPTPIAAYYGRYLPEAEVDLHLELIFGGGRIVRVEHHQMTPDGDSVALDRPADAWDFHDLFGAPLSLRVLWRAFIDRHLYADRLEMVCVQPGYYLGLRPFTDDPEVAGALFEDFGEIIEALRTERPYDAITFLRDREEEGIPVPFDESYHTWLAAYAHDVVEATIEPFVVGDSGTFIATLARHAALYGITVDRASDDQTLFVRFHTADLDVQLNLGPVFFRVLHEGWTFHQGLRRHFERELRALAAAAQVPALLRAALPDHRVEVPGGATLVVHDAQGRAVFADDLVAFATRHDLRTDEGIGALVAEVRGGAGTS